MSIKEQLKKAQEEKNGWILFGVIKGLEDYKPKKLITKLSIKITTKLINKENK